MPLRVRFFGKIRIERVLIIALDQCWWTNSDLDCSICCSIRKKKKLISEVSLNTEGSKSC